MNVWGRGSQRHRDTLDHRLQLVLDKVLPLRDLSIIDGYRDEHRQNTYYESGVSKVRFPNSKHNSLPSSAVDVQPSPYNEDTLREDLTYIAGLIVATGAALNIDIRWGGDWDADGETADNNFDDLFHFELRDSEDYTDDTI